MKWAEWLAEDRIGPFPAAIVVVAAYFVFQTITLSMLTYWAGTGVGIDDAEQLIYLPYLSAGYGGSQPPLYTWINWLAAHVLGTNVFMLKTVKYSVLFLAAWCVFAAMRRLGFTKTTAAAAMFGLFTIPQIVWESQRALSHSIAVVGFCALLVLAMVHLLDRRTAIAYAMFGLATTAAILAKYNDVFLVVALVAAALSLREFRGAILHPKIAVSLAVAALTLAPTAYWSLMHPTELLARGHKLGIDPQQGPIAAAAIGAGKFIMGTFDFVALPALIAALAFAMAGFHFSERHPKGPAKERLLWRTLAFGLAMLAILVLANGVTVVKARWLLPILFVVPLAVAAYMERLAPRGRDAQFVMIAAGAIIAILVTPITWYNQITGNNGIARALRMDYPALYRQLTADGPMKTAISDDPWVGNLRLVDKNTVALDDEVPDFATLLQEPATLVWLDDPSPNPVILDRIHQAGFVLDGENRSVRIAEFFGSSGGRLVTFVRLRKSEANDGSVPVRPD